MHNCDYIVYLSSFQHMASPGAPNEQALGIESGPGLCYDILHNG